MNSQCIEHRSSGRIIRHGDFGPAADLLRALAIMAFFAGSAVAVSHFAGDPGAAHAPVSEDWHGNVARSAR